MRKLEQKHAEGESIMGLERIDFIREQLKSKKVVYVNQLAEKLFVSPSTIRRDLGHLEKEGLVRRFYGGAKLMEHPSNEIPFFTRKEENLAAKEIIAELAADLVADNQVISLDATTTAATLPRFLHNKENLKIITTSAQIALDCLDLLLPARIFCTGGWLSATSRGFTGETTRMRIAEYYTDLAFFSARAFSWENGITDVNEEDVCLKQEMIRRTRKAVFLCDHTKFDQISYRLVCGAAELDCLVTDRRPSDEWLKRLESAGVEVIFPE